MIVTIAIPHQSKAKVQTFESEEEYINYIMNHISPERCDYNELTLTEIRELIEDGAEYPSDALKIAQKHGRVIAYSAGFDEEYYAPEYAPSLVEWARESAGYDYNRYLYFDSVEEAREFVENYHDHKAGEVKQAFRQAID